MNDLCYAVYWLHFIEKESLDIDNGFLLLYISHALHMLRPQEKREMNVERARFVKSQIKLLIGDKL